MISIEIDNVYSKIVGLTNVHIIDEIDNKLSYYVPGYRYMKAYTTGYFDYATQTIKHWDGKKHLLNNSLKFQTGLVPYVEEVLKKYELEYQLADKRKSVKFGKELPLNPSFYTPRDYQTNIVNAVIKDKNGIIKAATGAGKSFVIAMLVAKTNIKTVIYVISIDLLYQMKDTIEKALGIEVGIVGDGNCDIKQITVATVWTVAQGFGKKYDPFDDEERHDKKEKLNVGQKKNIVKMVNDSQMFIFDEAQFLGAESLQLIAQASKNARYRLCCSGTPWRDEGDDILLEAATGPQLIDVPSSYLIKRGVLVAPKIYFLKVPPYPSKIDKNYATIYNTYIVENDERNDMIIKSIHKLLEKKRKILVLVKRKKHGQHILDMIPSNVRAVYLDGDDDSEERKSIMDQFTQGELDVIIASSIFDQGIDLPTLDALILAGAGKSSGRALQRVGRVIRGSPSTGKKDAIVVDFIDDAEYLYEHSKKRFKIYKTESEFIIKVPKEE